jgi:hypothetical protein
MMNKHRGFALSPLIAGLLLITTMGQSQTYTPFDFKNGEWVCGYDTKGGQFGNYGTYYIREDVKLYCKGDTLINDKLYYKLYYIGVTRFPEWARRQLSGFYGLIREDTVRRQVWFRNQLLYDFNLQVGDSILFGCTGLRPILSVDSVLYCDKYHRRFNFKDQDDYDCWLIEGIGSIGGLIPMVCLTNISGLSCYAEKGNPVCDTCQTPASVNEFVLDKVDIFPNPTDDQIRITSPAPLTSVELVDLFGRRIYFDMLIAKNDITIQIRDKGIYILRVEIPGELIVRKVIRN